MVLITCSGKDAPGITARLTGVLARHGLEIVDIGQAVLHGWLSLSLLFQSPSHDPGAESLAIREKTFSATPLPLYPFKFAIPFAGAMLLLQGVVEIIRCVICLRDGDWPSREQDVEEVDVDKLKQMVKQFTFGAAPGTPWAEAMRHDVLRASSRAVALETLRRGFAEAASE